jgi:pilus assembly protein FimV
MRFRILSLAAILLATGSGVSQALGLGDIQLKSTLNAPLNAEIELIATPEELASLKTQIASRETFSRYGLDYPAFLSGIQVKPLRLPDGRTVVQLTSSAAMTEPFATLLIEAAWARGRNLREYTVLFDPPVFAPEPAAAAPIAAPVSGNGERSGEVARPSPVNDAPAASPPATVVDSASSSYTVRPGESLSSIARQQMGTSAERAMFAVYQANPDAFEGNMNRLRAGAVLRLPSADELATIDPGEAAREVRRQVAAWSGAGGQTASSRLRLVPPGGGNTPSAGDSAENQALRERVGQLESELGEARRLLELRNAELARLQGAARSEPAPPASTPEPVVPAPTTEVKPDPAAVTPAPVVETKPVEPAVTEPVVAPPPVRKPAVVTPGPVAGPSLFDRLKAFWFVPVGLLAIFGGLLGVQALRRRRAASASELTPFAVGAGAMERDSSSDTFPLRKPATGAQDSSFVVEESGTQQRPVFPDRDTHTVDLDDAATSTIVPTLDATAALEQGDPLAEADFHMAYGLYDQAADLIKLAIKREPGRRDLALKLLEVYFVWGNKDQFLQTARDLAGSRDKAVPGEWEKVIIMGKQLVPEDALFAQTYSGMGPNMVDLNLEGGQNLVDFELQGEPTTTFGNDSGIDMDLGNALGAKDDTGKHQLAGLDFTLDDPTRGGDMLSADLLARTATTRTLAKPDFDIGSSQRLDVEGPTVEQPAFAGTDTLIGKVQSSSRFTGGVEQTAELAIDDLGLDLGKLDATGSNLLDDAQLTRGMDSPDAPTLIAGLDETSRLLLQTSRDPNNPTELIDLSELDADVGATARVSVLDYELSEERGGHSAAAGLADSGIRLDLDVGTAQMPVDGEYQRTQRLDPPQIDGAAEADHDLEPVTMSEVGTKLDLARAYMDMGDPDGARSILDEVLQEGSASQRQEAQRLIDSIPG